MPEPRHSEVQKTDHVACILVGGPNHGDGWLFADPPKEMFFAPPKTGDFDHLNPAQMTLETGKVYYAPRFAKYERWDEVLDVHDDEGERAFVSISIPGNCAIYIYIGVV